MQTDPPVQPWQIPTDGIDIGYHAPSGWHDSFLRFPDVGIPQGAVIISASLETTLSGTINGLPGPFTVYGNDVDNAVAPTAGTDIDNFVYTSSSLSASYSVTVDQTNAIDVTDIVQEIIDRGGWDPGNAVLFRLTVGTYISSTFGYFCYAHSDGADLPELIITWTTPLVLTCPNLSLNTYNAAINLNVVVSTTAASLALTSHMAYVSGPGEILCYTTQLNITSYGVDISHPLLVECGTAVLETTLFAADVSLAVMVDATTAELSIEPLSALVSFSLGKTIDQSAMIYETLDWQWLKTSASTAEIVDTVTAETTISVKEVLTVKDTPSAKWAGTETINETIKAIALDIQLQFNMGISESLVASDAPTWELSILVSEWLKAVDTVTSNYTGTMSIAEVLRAVDDSIAQRLYGLSIAESASITDVPTLGLLINAVISSGATVADAVTGTYKPLPSIMEALMAVDAITDSFHPMPVVQETFAMVASVLGTPYFNNIVTENWTIADTLAFAWDSSVVESLAVTDAIELQRLVILSATSALIATENTFGSLQYSDTISETLQVIGALLVSQKLGVFIEEILNAEEGLLLNGEVWEAWVITSNKFNMSVYSGFEFNSYAVYDGVAYGAKADGIYKLSGSTDNGTAISAGIVLPETDFGSSRQKRFRKAYFGISGTTPSIRMETDNGSVTYTIADDKANIQRNQKGKEWTLKISGFTDLDFIELVPIILTRR